MIVVDGDRMGVIFHHDHGMFTSAPLAAMPLRGMVL
jgi:hypothetical protein